MTCHRKWPRIKQLCSGDKEPHFFGLPLRKTIKRQPMMCPFKEASNKRLYACEECNLCCSPSGNFALGMSCLASPAVSHADASHRQKAATKGREVRKDRGATRGLLPNPPTLPPPTTVWDLDLVAHIKQTTCLTNQPTSPQCVGHGASE